MGIALLYNKALICIIRMALMKKIPLYKLEYNGQIVKESFDINSLFAFNLSMCFNKGIIHICYIY